MTLAMHRLVRLNWLAKLKYLEISQYPKPISVGIVRYMVRISYFLVSL